MEVSILDYLRTLYAKDFPDKYLREAFSQDENKKLAELGDSVLDLVVYEYTYNLTDVIPKTLDDARQTVANNRYLKRLLNQDTKLKQYLIDKYRCTSPLDSFSEERASAFIEDIIGAIYLSFNINEARSFIKQYLPLEKIKLFK